MKTIKDFIDNLGSYDIDLIDKLDNLCGHGQISETVYYSASKKDNFESIEDYIREILQDQVGDSALAKEYIAFIIEETESLYGQGLSEKDDFTSGLYNCDDIYLYAIADVLDLDISDLECYEE